MKIINIAVDCMGGDNAPVDIVKGAIDSLVNKEIKVTLLGDEKKITSELNKYEFNTEQVEVVYTTETIENCESPTAAIKGKKDSSMVVGMNLVKEGKADAFISAGSTGALLAGATMIVGRIKGVKRPVLTTLLPAGNKHVLLLDAGANVDCKAEYLNQFGIIGSLYMEKVVGVKNPTVGLLNVGTEEEKGNQLTKETFPLLSGSNINFVGNVEARDLPLGVADVVVCDGFVGNIALKLYEGTGKFISGQIKSEISSSLISKVGGLLSLSAFKKLKKKTDYREVGGAPFLGLNSLVVKAHGSSDALAIKNGIFQCYNFAKSNIVDEIKNNINV
ncbi:MAG: phosphate acyltransferase PlsX [Lachnospirales bacterium]